MPINFWSAIVVHKYGLSLHLKSIKYISLTDSKDYIYQNLS